MRIPEELDEEEGGGWKDWNLEVDAEMRNINGGACGMWMGVKWEFLETLWDKRKGVRGEFKIKPEFVFIFIKSKNTL